MLLLFFFFTLTEDWGHTTNIQGHVFPPPPLGFLSVIAKILANWSKWWW
jgi:hypothetical protein